MVEAAGPLDGPIVASPSNPTGSLLSRQRLEEMARYCEARGIRLISDEIYHGLTYGEPAASAVEYSTRAISINSFSKYYSMAGWRLGWMVMPEELVRPVERLAQNFFICPSSVAQAAALAAFEATYQSALGCAFGASALATASRSLTTRSFASSRSSGFAALLTSSRYISNS